MRNLAMRNLAPGILLALAMACGHGSPAPVAHDAAGCLAACPGASVVETSEDGRMCRCWSHKAGVQYTFVFPDSEQRLEYSRGRWLHSIGVVTGCKAQGLGWEPTPDGNDLMCVKPEEPDPLKNALRWTSLDEKHADEKHGPSVGSP